MSRFDPRAIIVAMLISLALDVVGGVVLIGAMGTGIEEGMTQAQVAEAIQVTLQSSSFLAASLAFGLITTGVGGFAAARLARGYPYFNALAIGVLGIVLGLWLSDDLPAWFHALAYTLSIPAALLGGHLAKRRR